MAGRLRQLLHAQDRGNVAQRRQGVAELVRERREEFILQLRFVVQAMLAILDRGTCFLRFIGAAFGFFFRLPQLRFDLLALGDVHQQPLALGSERLLLMLLQRDVRERADHAGQAAVGIALGMRPVGDVNQAAVLGDHARLAIHFRSRAGAAERVLDVVAIVGMDQRQARACGEVLQRVTEQHLQAAGRRIDQDLAAHVDARVEREVRGELADQPVKVLALAQARLFD